MVDGEKFSEFALVTSMLANDYLPFIRGFAAGSNKRIKFSDVAASAETLLIGRGNLVVTFNGRSGAVELTSADLNGLSGAGLSGIGTGTGGVINTGTTTIGGDSDANGVGVVVLQTRGIPRLQVNNDGTGRLFANDFAVGTAGGPNSAGRLRLATNADEYNAVYSTSFDFTNGPPGEENYTDHNLGLGYNQTFNHQKDVVGLVNLGLIFEPKFYAGGFQTEIYIQWTDPDDALTFRPWGMVIAHSSGNTLHGLVGDVAFFRNPPDHATQTAGWDADGVLELLAAAAAIVVPNDVAAYKGKNNAGDFTVSIAKIRTDDKVEIDPGGVGVVMPANLSVLSMTDLTTISGVADADTRLQFTGSGIIDLRSDGNLNLRSQPGNVTSSVDVYVDAVLHLKDGTMKTVVFGANDSGGSGFRMLRVEN